MIHRNPLNTSRSGCFRCGASSVIRVRYGATNAHSSSLTSLGYGFLAVGVDSIPQLYGTDPEKFITGFKTTEHVLEAGQTAIVETAELNRPGFPGGSGV